MTNPNCPDCGATADHPVGSSKCKRVKAMRESGTELSNGMPWDVPELSGWNIVGMNHYYLQTGEGRERFLYVAMVRGTTCIVARDVDEKFVFDKLGRAAKQLDYEREAYDHQT